MNETVYLDYNATAKVRPQAVDAVLAALGEVGNASSVHGPGRRARRIVEEARNEVATLVGAQPGQVVFLSGGTEANNQIMGNLEPEDTLMSAIEHPAVRNACPGAGLVPVDSRGLLDLTALEAKLAEAPGGKTVSVMLANNETGAIQPLGEIAGLAGRYGAFVHSDAVQAAGKIPVDFASLGIDSMALSAHKLGGPQGIGALVLRDPDRTVPLLRGGGQERGLRPGTEAVALIAGFGAAARLARDSLSDFAGLERLRNHMEEELSEAEPGFRVLSRDAPRLPNTSQCIMPGVGAETQLMAFDLEGIAISAGSACSSGRVEPPYVLSAMGVPDKQAQCAVRVSLGWDTRIADIERFIEVWKVVFARAGSCRRSTA